VDIKKLKNDLWTELSAHKCITPDADADASKPAAPLSFKDTQDKLDLLQKQADASTAYGRLLSLSLPLP
jgi:hypothetical protein